MRTLYLQQTDLRRTIGPLHWPNADHSLKTLNKITK